MIRVEELSIDMRLLGALIICSMVSMKVSMRIEEESPSSNSMK